MVDMHSMLVFYSMLLGRHGVNFELAKQTVKYFNALGHEVLFTSSDCFISVYVAGSTISCVAASWSSVA